MATKKRVVIVSDLHCGHVVGLTPESWQLEHKEEVDSNWSKWNKWVNIQEKEGKWRLVILLVSI